MNTQQSIVPSNFWVIPGVAPMPDHKPAVSTLLATMRQLNQEFSTIDQTTNDLLEFRAELDLFRRTLLNKITGLICAKFNQDPEVLKSTRRYRVLVLPRQVIMTLTMEPKLLNFTTVRAGKEWNKDHATAIHARKCVRNLYQTNKYFRAEMNDILGMLDLIADDCMFLKEDKK